MPIPLPLTNQYPTKPRLGRRTANTASKAHGDLPVTPDGRYFVVRGRLWRMSNPYLDADVKAKLVKDLMQARRDVSKARRTDDAVLEADARSRVQCAKVSLGERGPVWWDQRDGDHNQRLAKNTPYAGWFSGLSDDGVLCKKGKQ